MNIAKVSVAISELLGVKVVIRKHMAPWHAFIQHT